MSFEVDIHDEGGNHNGEGCVFANGASGGSPKRAYFSFKNDTESLTSGCNQAKTKQSRGECSQQLLKCPSRIVLEETESTGPEKCWKEGHLSRGAGFLPQDMSHLGTLQNFPGPSSWATLGRRMPGLLAQNHFREVVRQLPVVSSNIDVLPDQCLHEDASVL